MDIHEIFTGGSDFLRKNRPQHPDLDRISEIVLELKAETKTDPETQELRWKARVSKTCDFDSILWQAMQVGFDIMRIETGADLAAMRANQMSNASFVAIIQAFMDGWIMANEFRDRGGKR